MEVMQRCSVRMTGRFSCLRRLSQTPALATTSATLLATPQRCFVQGAPPLSKDAEKTMRDHYRRTQQDRGIGEKYKRRQQELHEYFTKHEPNCPEPLEENAFVKGKFGMRRRYLVDHRSPINSQALNDALDASTNAMRK